jgi:AcrR family transcriptional regulator
MMTDKRADILQATLKLVSEHGFHGTPMAKVAEGAGVGAGTIYRYFENKETLINELYVELKREISRAMLRGFSPEASPEEIFRRVLRNTFDYCVQNPQEMVFLEQYHNSPFLTPETEAATAETLAPLQSAFRSAIAAGEMKNLSFEMLSIFAYDMVVALAKRQLSGALALDEATLQTAFQACWDAVKVH